MAAGTATIYRDYFCKADGRVGQTSTHQLNGLADVGVALSAELGNTLQILWSMRNGYAMCAAEGLDAISSYLRSCRPDATDSLRGLLRIGVHGDVQVTDRIGAPALHVSQAFCPALPVAYARSRMSLSQWEAFATLILEAAYEATLWAAVLNAQRTGSNIVFLTRLGGGVFGNEAAWTTSAMRRAFQLASGFGLDVPMVRYGTPSTETLKMVDDFAGELLDGRFGQNPWLQAKLERLRELAERDPEMMVKEVRFSMMKMSTRLSAKDEVAFSADEINFQRPAFLRKKSEEGKGRSVPNKPAP